MTQIEEDDDDDNDVLDLEKLSKIVRFQNVKSAAYKTVETFAGLTKRKLWLKDGALPSTDGHEIRVPMRHPKFYRLMEHELAHILFRSDVRARQEFVGTYATKICEVAKKANVELSSPALGHMLEHFVNVLEDRRVDSLGALLYEGSAKLIGDLSRETLTPHVDAAAKNMMAYFSCIEAGVPVDDEELGRYKPYFQEALKKVERRGFVATLAVSKWLITCLVTEMIRQAKDQPPPPPWQSPQGGQGEGESGEGQGEGENDDEWRPPEGGGGTSEERSQMLQQLLDQLEQQGLTPEDIRRMYDDVQQSKFAKRGAQQEAKKEAEQALRTDVTNEEKLDQLLDGSEEGMQSIIDEAREALRQEFNENEWLQKDAMAKLSFHDVKRAQVLDTPELELEDRETVNRLKALFHRVMGKKRASLEDSGSEIDVQAFVEAKLTGVPVPCFKSETRGRGFKAMVLVDKSSSMNGSKSRQASRACRMLGRALSFPFVDLRVWGFSSRETGQADIYRFERGVEEINGAASPNHGCTPLHVAIRIAVRQMEKGTEAKHLFVLTDGFPVHSRRDGRSFSTKQLMMFVRDEVQEARQNGIHVTGVLIGDQGYRDEPARFDMSPKQMKFMFGPQKFWSRMTPDRLGSDLVKLVSNNVLEFLTNG
jgi:hypothetical protein